MRSGCIAVPTILLCLVAGTVDASAQITGGMLNPDMDAPGEPFSYFWHPTDVIGTLLAPVASEVTPEGYVYTGFGELMFFTGNPPEPVQRRVKTLRRGYLPILQYQITKNEITYSFTIFAADCGGELSGIPVNFVKVELKNTSQEQRTGFLSSAYRFSVPNSRLYGPADYRFGQRADLLPKEYVEGQTRFNPDWKYSFSRNRIVRDGRVLYLFPVQPKPNQFSLALGDKGLRMERFFTGEVSGNPDPRHTLDPHLPMGVVHYRIQLKPQENQALVFKIPVVPLPENSGATERVEGADCEEQLQKTVRSWDELVAKTAPLRIPEEKVQHFLLANTITSLLAIDKVGEDYIPNVNKFQYHTFYGGGDTCYMLNALDFMGLHDIVRKTLLYSLTTQRADGAFILPRHPGEHRYWETFGWSLWGWGAHYQLTRDENFLRQIYPGVQKAVQWEKKITGNDPLGLLPPPPAEIADDAFLKSSRQTGQHIWLLIGLKNAMRLAEAAGKSDDVAAFRAEYDRFWKAFETLLNAQTARSGGYIPPALENTLEGNDWDNLHLLWPEPLFEKFDSRVTATLRRSRSEYVEGILDFVVPRAISKDGWAAQPEGVREGGYTFETSRSLHYWQVQNNSHNHLVRGSAEDQQLAVKDLYAVLLHTSSTHGTQEFGTYPWSTRDYEGAATHDIMPDGPASGKTIELIRNMIVREYKNDLYLLSAVSPVWLQAGKNIEAINEPTEFGPLTMKLAAGATGLDLTLSDRFRNAPGKIVISIPWFYQAQQAEVDGRPVKITDGKLIVAPGAKRVKIAGGLKPGMPPLSFSRAVEDFKAEYRRRYREFLRTGKIQP